jgi:hypothetical protein
MIYYHVFHNGKMLDVFIIFFSYLDFKCRVIFMRKKNTFLSPLEL